MRFRRNKLQAEKFHLCRGEGGGGGWVGGGGAVVPLTATATEPSQPSTERVTQAMCRDAAVDAVTGW